MQYLTFSEKNFKQFATNLHLFHLAIMTWRHYQATVLVPLFLSKLSRIFAPNTLSQNCTTYLFHLFCLRAQTLGIHQKIHQTTPFCSLNLITTFLFMDVFFFFLDLRRLVPINKANKKRYNIPIIWNRKKYKVIFNCSDFLHTLNESYLWNSLNLWQ